MIRCKITAKTDASKRTKERVKQHGPIFIVDQINADNGEMYLKSPDGWFGWLSVKEFDLVVLDK